MKAPSRGAIGSEDSRRRRRLGRCVLALLAAIGAGAGLASCGDRPAPDDVTYQECQWGVGCTPQCTLKYGRSSYCDRD